MREPILKLVSALCVCVSVCLVPDKLLAQSYLLFMMSSVLWKRDNLYIVRAGVKQTAGAEVDLGMV